MNFNGCEFQRVLDLSGIPNLIELHLDGCKNLIEIHDSIGSLEKLVWLSADKCTNLNTFPADIRLPSLKYLNLRSCNKLEKFPSVLAKMETISWIDLCHTAIKELPSSIENLVGLQELSLSFCKRLQDLPSSICKLENLFSLELEDCREVMLSGNNFVLFPECILELVSLECLRLNNCKQLQTIPRDILPRLKIIDALNCTLMTFRVVKLISLPVCLLVNDIKVLQVSYPIMYKLEIDHVWLLIYNIIFGRRK
ncbi:putative Disease resistance protein (TIR-NBS-LRR class) [Quillaja saponaria]|nr:putative Disease resistance protein (TIR-NBS-LRR class) [Quillaja saponaria]